MTILSIVQAEAGDSSTMSWASA
ncbi:uncharacterized protein METZ01_LOCUS31878 [marine metagenome]|uniref:Uncharacterized protein n=1 Tax=marine metagenome TaxID=408172 RepID=A0A381QJE7_9ZZZZ